MQNLKNRKSGLSTKIVVFDQHSPATCRRRIQVWIGISPYLYIAEKLPSLQIF